MRCDLSKQKPRRGHHSDMIRQSPGWVARGKNDVSEWKHRDSSYIWRAPGSFFFCEEVFLVGYCWDLMGVFERFAGKWIDQASSSSFFCLKREGFATTHTTLYTYMFLAVLSHRFCLLCFSIIWWSCGRQANLIRVERATEPSSLTEPSSHVFQLHVQLVPKTSSWWPLAQAVAFWIEEPGSPAGLGLAWSCWEREVRGPGGSGDEFECS